MQQTMALTNVVYIENCANGAVYQAYRPAWGALELKTLTLLPATYWIGSAAKMNRAKAMLQSLANGWLFSHGLSHNQTSELCLRSYVVQGFLNGRVKKPNHCCKK